MNGYVCFWNGRRVEVNADTSFKAQQEAELRFLKVAGRKRVKRSDISVTLAEKNGEQVTHRPVE